MVLIDASCHGYMFSLCVCVCSVFVHVFAIESFEEGLRVAALRCYEVSVLPKARPFCFQVGGGL